MAIYGKVLGQIPCFSDISRIKVRIYGQSVKVTLNVPLGGPKMCKSEMEPFLVRKVQNWAGTGNF